MKSESKIFLADYGSYNDGSQFEFGHWVELDQFLDADELNDYITKHFEKCDKESPLEGGTPREETMITDFEGFPKEFYSESGMDFESLFEFFDRIEGSPYDQEVIEAFADLGNYSVTDVDEFFKALEESYQGEYDSDKDFAQSMAEETGAIQEDTSWPYTCIDWERAAREIMYDYNESNGYYFRQI